MFSALNYTASARLRIESSSNDVQKLFEIGSTTIEEVLSFPNIVSELHAPVATHGFFTNDRLEQLIAIVFDPNALRKYSFDDGRKYAYIASEILSSKITPISDFFFHKETVAGANKKPNKVDELDVENDFEVGKDLLLSPVNSVKSKSAQIIEICNKTAVANLINRALSRENLDETRAGYLAKILNSFFQRTKNEFLSFFYKSGFEYNRFLGFLDFYSITDFLNNVVLYENNMSNDSMIFQDTQPQISADFSPLRVEFFGSIITSPEIRDSFEVASNIKQLIESFFSKYKNIAETDDFMKEIFVNRHYFQFLKDRLSESRNSAVSNEYLSIIKLVSAFFVLATNQKLENLSKGTKEIFQHDSPAYKELLDLVETLKEFVKVITPKPISINSFMQPTTNSTIRNQICLLETFGNLLKQKVVDVSPAFLNKEFLTGLLVS